MSLWSPDLYTAAWKYAAEAHIGQLVPGSDIPYIAHVGNVAMEVACAIAARGGIERADLAIQCALLHDVVEDTERTVADIRAAFGNDVAAGVGALTKDDSLATKAEKMADSLERIRNQPQAVWMVKLADRITNLQPPPAFWSDEKTANYRDEAESIHAALQSACPILGPRLAEKIAAYPP